ncbi:hypothetical protein FOL47_001793 [Perkinsus chesapeaki]|uniref:Protein kinase domain-containing protein n=1 Tax=Perkinsus chesapeaki TaxID=330153 RepID=A0A7J6MGZ0_PERCH|nr:hypothetical protein FOL47_001793 [Perkinsus chesapeaki]
MQSLLLPGIGRHAVRPPSDEEEENDEVFDDIAEEPRRKGSLRSLRSRISTMADTPLTDTTTRRNSSGSCSGEDGGFEEQQLGGKKLCQDDFEVVGSLGYGGYGVVRLVRSVVDDKLYAMKSVDKWALIERRNTGDQRVVQRLSDERDFYASASHDCPFLVQFAGSFQSSKRFYFVLEFCSGGELLDRVGKCGGKLSLDAFKIYFAELCIAVDFIHNKHHAIHRDIKLENVLIGSDGHVRLTDFGCCKANLNRFGGGTNSVIGFSINIMPPEFFTGAGYGYPLDWFQMGIIGFEMLNGRHPFGNFPLDPEDDETRYPPRYNNDIPVEYQELINGLLAPDSHERWSSLDRVKESAVYEGFDWGKAAKKEMPVPWKPAEIAATPKDEVEYETDDLALVRRRTSITDHYDPLHLRRFSFCYGHSTSHDLDATPRSMEFHNTTSEEEVSDDALVTAEV